MILLFESVFLQIAAESERLLIIYQKERREMKKKLIREKQKAKEVPASVSPGDSSQMMEANVGINLSVQIYNENEFAGNKQVPEEISSGEVVTPSGNRASTYSDLVSPASIDRPVSAIVNFDPNDPALHHTDELNELITINKAVKIGISECVKLIFEKFIEPELSKERSRTRLLAKGMHGKNSVSMDEEIALKSSVEFISCVQSLFFSAPTGEH